MKLRDRLVDEACRRAEVTRAAARDSASLTLPERPARGAEKVSTHVSASMYDCGTQRQAKP
jgi:hypothetical protein